MPVKYGRLEAAGRYSRRGNIMVGLHQVESTGALRYANRSNDMVWVNDHFPTFRNERADCLRVSLLSILHHIDPECLLTLDALRQVLCNGKNVGTDIASAALLLNLLGVKAVAYASSTERIPEGPLELARKYKLVQEKILPPKTINAMIQARLGVICCIDAGAITISGSKKENESVARALADVPLERRLHALLVTGASAKGKALTVHDSRRPPWFHGYDGEENALRLWRHIEPGRAAHDYHTLVVDCVPSAHLARHRQKIRGAIFGREKFWPALTALSPVEGPETNTPYDQEKPPGLLPAMTIKPVPYVRSPQPGCETAAATLSAMRNFDRLFIAENAKSIDRGMHRHNPNTRQRDIADIAQSLDRNGYKYRIYGELTAGQKRRIGRPVKAFKAASLRALCKSAEKGEVPLCFVNLSKLHKTHLRPQWQAVAMAGWRFGNIVYHDPGLASRNISGVPYEKELFKRFDRARMPGASTIIVTGRAPHKTADRWIFRFKDKTTTQQQAPAPAPQPDKTDTAKQALAKLADTPQEQALLEKLLNFTSARRMLHLWQLHHE